MIKLYVKNIDGIWFGVAYIDERILATTFTDKQQATLGNLLEILPFDVAFEVVPDGSAFAEKAISFVKDAYDGKDVKEEIPLAFECLPAYSGKVLKAVSQIPAGYVSSYALVAKAVGGGARAVGNVMAANPFAPIVPCHRVVTSDLRLGGYGGGLAIKFEFLKRERKGYTEPKVISVDGQQLQVFPAEAVFARLEKTFPNVFTTNPFAKNNS